jgi:hypothetical protein
VRTFLTDANPARIGMNVNPRRTPQGLEELSTRLAPLRDELSIFAGADEDDRVMARTGQIETALFNLVHWDRQHATDLLRKRDPVESLKTAEYWHVRALTLTRIVLDLLRDRDVAGLEERLRKLDETKPS